MGLVLPLAAICTSYIGITLSEVDNIKEFLRINKLYAWDLTVAPPLLIYFAGLKSFVNGLWLAGTFSGVVYAGILPTMISLKAKKKYDSFHLHFPHSMAYLSGLVFLVVFIYSLASLV
ncbi:aromatic amino acid transport family protein [Thermococcus sp.]|uniref:aromatic amino acid transport family protein n=1 Tax=Thermococcus sp. TaxID=35749 RepID=UPI0026312629|nr:aromatic amino acid transport family protein [Thermococcus sp.]